MKDKKIILEYDSELQELRIINDLKVYNNIDYINIKNINDILESLKDFLKNELEED